MNEIILQLGGKSFKLEFGLGLFRLLGRKWQLDGIDDVVQKIAVLDSIDKKLTFSQLDVLEELLLAAIENGGTQEDLKGLKILDEFFKDPKALDSLKDAIINSLPKNEPLDHSGKPKALRRAKHQNP
jgi:hypothetical protein